MTPALVVCFRWNSNRAFYITYTKFYEKYVWFSKLYVRKKDSFHMDLVWKWAQIEQVGGQNCFTFLLPSRSLLTPLPDLWGGLVMLEFVCRVFSKEHFRLTCLWVCFVRWLWLTVLSGCTRHISVAWGPTEMFLISHGRFLWPKTIRSVVAWEASPQGLVFFPGYFCWLTFCLVQNNGF